MRNWVARRLNGKQLFGHPVGLFALFLTEMWERFSYYGMRALLVLYMTKYLLADPHRAAMVWGYGGLERMLTHVFGPLTVQQIGSQIYGIYTAFVYFTPLFGGLLADRVLGQYRTVYIGGALMAIGHFLMASEHAFLLALTFLVLGNGCFKPNIATQVGSLYREGDPRRDGAFTIFYMGVNLGAFFSPLICGTLGQTVGWDWGFGAAGVGMVLGLFIYWLGSGLVPHEKTLRKAEQVAQEEAHKPFTRQDWIAVGSLVAMIFLNISFWAVYEQQGNTLQLWADDSTNWSIFGWFTVPSTWFQSFNPAMIFIFAPLLTRFWLLQAKKGREPSSISKLGIGCYLMGSAYLVMIAAARAVPEGSRGSVLWLTGATFLATMGELYLSPVGLSLVTKVAPRKVMSMFMGAWYMANFFGNYLTGYLGTFYNTMPKQRFFLLLASIAAASGVAFTLAKGPLDRAIGKKV
jgi:POT family proton-dependent oligopeptide transporter